MDIGPELTVAGKSTTAPSRVSPEVGPASGFLTKEMARRGAQVTCIDLPTTSRGSRCRSRRLVEEVHQQRKRRRTHLLRRSW